MNYFSIDYLIVYAFLAITLVMGIRAGRGIKDIKDYAIANRSFGTGALILTYLATNLAGASVINGTAGIASEGIIDIFAIFGLIITFLVHGFFIAPNIVYFKDCLTMGDIMENLYGRRSKIIAGILGTLTAICLTGMELSLLGFIGKSLFGISPASVIVICGIFLAAYTIYGGMRSVTATDIFQFFVFVVIFPIVAFITLNKAGGLKEVFTNIPVEKLQVIDHPNLSLYITLFLMWSIFPAGMIDPALIQRMLMINTKKQARVMFGIIAAFDPIFQIMLLLISFSAILLFPGINGQEIVPHVIKTLLPVGMKGLGMVSLLAICMSSITAFLHAAGVSFSHDVIKTLVRKENTYNEVNSTRIITSIASIVAIIVALYSKDSFGLLLDSFAFTGPILMFPIIAGMMGLKPEKLAFYIAMVGTITTFIVCKYYFFPDKSHLVTLTSILVNGTIFFGIHVFQNKGFAIINREKDKELVWRPHRKSIVTTLRHFIPTPKSIVKYSRKKVALYGAPYIPLGVFLTLNYVFPYFLWATIPSQYQNTMLALRLIGGTLCGLLIVQEKWSKKLLPYMPIFWYVTVLFCLPFTHTILYLISQGSTEWLISFMGIIILLFILLDWVTALVLGILGVFLGTLCFTKFVGTINFNINFLDKYLLIYQGIFGILIGIIFARRKQLHFDRIAADKETLTLLNEEQKETLLDNFKDKIRLLKTLNQAKVEDITKAATLANKLAQEQKQGIMSAVTINQLQHILTPMATGLERIESRATDYLRLQVAVIGLETLFAAIRTSFPNLHIKNLSSHKEITCDVKGIEKTFINSMEVLKSFLEESAAIYLTLEDTYLTYPLPRVKRDGSYVKEISAICFSLSNTINIPQAKPSYQAQMQREALPTSMSPISLLLADNKRMIKAHYGYTNIDINQTNDCTMYRYVLPVRIQDVRPRDMDSPNMELGADLLRADDTYPGAQEQERAFLALVQQKTNANLGSIEIAIEMIKLYHGSVRRKSGEPFYLHPLMVAQIVLDYNTDEATIIGALLHDVVEDTSMLLETIELRFGREVASIVDGVTHFESLEDSFYKIQLSDEENILMLLELKETRALYVKVADRMHNMRTIEGHSSYAKKQQIAQETLQFFVPLARELSLEEAAQELKERSMQVIKQMK